MTVRAGCRFAVLAVASLVATVGGVVGIPVSRAQTTVRLSVTVDGRDLAGVTANRALRLDADRPVDVRLRVQNGTTSPVFVRSVRLDSTVIGLTFFAFETRVDLRVGPGEEGERAFSIDLLDLRRQATGLLPARLALLDGDRRVIVSQSFPADVRGSLLSTYGVFGTGVAAITAVLLGTVLVRLAGQRLPRNRWRRALRFAVPGFGIGLTVTFTLSVFRVVVPSAGKWLVVIFVFGAGLFVVGYLTPSPDHDDDDGPGDGGGDHGPRASSGAGAVSSTVTARRPGVGASGDRER